jgi:hypothetical protein
VIDGGDEDDLHIVSEKKPTSVVAPPPQKKEGDNIRHGIIARFNLYDLREIMKANPQELGFFTEPCRKDVFNWQIHIFGRQNDSSMFDDLIKYRRESLTHTRIESTSLDSASSQSIQAPVVFTNERFSTVSF